MKRTFELSTDGTELEVVVEATNAPTSYPNKTVYHCAIKHDGVLMFDWHDLEVPRFPWQDTDLEAMSAALVFAGITYEDGVDDDYFSEYTPEMIAFVEKYSDDMSTLGEDLEAEAVV